jgi:hypothetical protein
MTTVMTPSVVVALTSRADEVEVAVDCMRLLEVGVRKRFGPLLRQRAERL